MNVPERLAVWGLLIVVLSISACGNATTPPDWPLHPAIWLVNTTTDSVYLMAAGDESIDAPVIAAPLDSAHGAYNAHADSIPVVVHSWTAPGVEYGSAWLFPLRASAWRAVVGTGGVTLTHE